MISVFQRSIINLKFSDYLYYLDFSKKQEITEIRNC